MVEYINDLIKEIDIKNEKVNGIRPLNNIALSKLRDELKIKIISNSLNIENIHITARETRMLLNGAELFNGDFKDKVATLNLCMATQLLEKDLREEININFINKVHLLVMTGLTSNSYCGKLRNEGVIITESQHIPPKSSKVPELLNCAFKEYYENIDEHILIKIFKLHHKITNIHPYFDGNGRVSRLVMNYTLMQNSYLPIVIRDKVKYYDVLEYADLYYDNRRLYIFLLEELNKTYDDYIKRIYALKE